MIAEIIVDILNSEVDKIFDYIANEDIKIGQRVLVPFGNRTVEGYVINIKQTSSCDKSKLKSVIKALDKYPVIIPEMLELSKFLVKKYNLRVMDTLRLFLPSGMRKDKVKTVVNTICFLNKDISSFNCIKKNAKNQFAIVNYLKNKTQENITTLNSLFGNASVKKLIELNVINTREDNIYNSLVKSTQSMPNHTLTKYQQEAVDKICKDFKKIFLLFGVTGSGKTEVYMKAIQNCIENKKTAIMLVPEIGLTPQVMKNFIGKFGQSVAILHSGLSNRERYDEWHRILNGEANIVVGARSAVFAPVRDLGLIIIDEEHDGSYFSESNPRYSTIDVAKFRINYNNANLVLGSATPSVETYEKALKNEYELIELPNRVNGKEMPSIQIVDMCSEIRNGNSGIFSNILLGELNNTFKQGNQALLFLNRRGYVSFVRCTDCGYVAKCEDCDVSLVYHKEDEQLKCHYCGKRYLKLACCPNCKSTALRQGAVGTQKVVEELKKFFPNIPVFRMDNDTTQNKNSHTSILEQFSNTKPSVLVGTQMIAKGHDFPNITFVGIIDADVSLHFADFRAQERTFQLITQVAGRAGRSEKQGKVVLQTYCPNHFVYRYATEYNYKKFFEKELNLRKVTKFPPYSVIVRVLLTCENEDFLKQYSKEYACKIDEIRNENKNDFIYFNLMKSPVKRIQTKFRYQILIRLNSKNADNILQEIFKIDKLMKKKEVLTFVEINPQSLS